MVVPAVVVATTTSQYRNGWNFFAEICADDRDHEDADEDEAADGVAEVHRHRNGIAAGFAKRRCKDLDDPEYQRDFRNLAAFDILIHAVSFLQTLSASRYFAFLPWASVARRSRLRLSREDSAASGFGGGQRKHQGFEADQGRAVQRHLARTATRDRHADIGEFCQRRVVRFGDQNGRQTQRPGFGKHRLHFPVETAIGEDEQRISIAEVEKLIGQHRAGGIDRPAAAAVSRQQNRKHRSRARRTDRSRTPRSGSAPSRTRTLAAIWVRHFSDRRTSRPSACACNMPSSAWPVAFSRSTSVRRMSSAGVEAGLRVQNGALRSARPAKPRV